MPNSILIKVINLLYSSFFVVVVIDSNNSSNRLLNPNFKPSFLYWFVCVFDYLFENENQSERTFNVIRLFNIVWLLN